ncbi:hypothetical protein YC2023_119837 [Brassica napus]
MQRIFEDQTTSSAFMHDSVIRSTEGGDGTGRKPSFKILENRSNLFNKLWTKLMKELRDTPMQNFFDEVFELLRIWEGGF